jgi:3-dehydroquinate synthase
LALGIKRAVVEKDEFELFHRKCLNYGHTIGHVLEVLSDYRIPHGQAVTLGIVAANRMSCDRNILKRNCMDELEFLLYDIIDPKNLLYLKRLKADNLENLLRKDKKTMGNDVRFVFIKKPGEAIFVSLKITQHILHEILDDLKGILKKRYG